MKNPFIRQAELKKKLVCLIVPQVTQFPNRFSFSYFPIDGFDKYLEDEAELSDGIYTFKVKEGVLGVFDTVVYGNMDFGWSFASSKVIDVLAAIRIGEVTDIEFNEPFAEVYHIQRYSFPPGVSDSGYGQFRFHITEDCIRNSVLRVVSSFEKDQVPTCSRLPFFLGFRIFGSEYEGQQEPIWRNLLSLSLRYCQEEKWHLSIIHAAFSLESFIDTLLKQYMLDMCLPEDYIEHILIVGGKMDELQALNKMCLNNKYSKSQITKRYEKLNELVFSKRNKIAHGSESSQMITQDDVILALRETVEFIWDFSLISRKDLLITIGSKTFENMIDEELINSCIGIAEYTELKEN